MTLAASHHWFECCTDGFAVTGFETDTSEDFELEVTFAYNPKVYQRKIKRVYF
jgi:hypothetical protein